MTALQTGKPSSRLLVPLGPRDSLEGVLEKPAKESRIAEVIAVALPGTPPGATDALKSLAASQGARLTLIQADLGDSQLPQRVYEALKAGPQTPLLYVSLATGPAYLHAAVNEAVLRYARETATLVLGLLRGQEVVTPIASIRVELTDEEERLLKAIYSRPGHEVSLEALPASDDALRSLEEKGLAARRGAAVRKTFAGLLVYQLLRAAGLL